MLTSILNNIGVMTSQINSTPTNPPTSTNSLVAQLQTDEDALQKELKSLAGKSAVTAADLTQLSTDSQALAMAVQGVSTAALQKALDDLAAAATGSSTVTSASALSEFTACSPTANQAAATTVYNDLVKIVNDSGVDVDRPYHRCLDQAAIQTDLNNLRGGGSSTAPPRHGRYQYDQ